MMKEIFEKRYGLKLKELPNNAKHEIGKTYFCGYWQQTYKVLDYKDAPEKWYQWFVTCLWQDGTISTHSTDFDCKQDFEVVGMK